MPTKVIVRRWYEISQEFQPYDLCLINIRCFDNGKPNMVLWIIHFSIVFFMKHKLSSVTEIIFLRLFSRKLSDNQLLLTTQHYL